MKSVKTPGAVKSESIQKLLIFGQNSLKKAKIKESWLESEILICAAIGKSREFILTHPEYSPSNSETENFIKLIGRRAKREPIAYIVGFQEFYGYQFFVNKNVLIPRPETEGLIDLSSKEFKKISESKIKNVDIIDVGTGSGAIIISIAKFVLESRIMKSVSFYAIDSSNRALNTAQKNAKRLGLANQIQFLRGNLIQPIINQIKDYKLQTTHYKLFLTNLPYLTSSEMKNLQPEIRYEPKNALDGGKDGLDVYLKLFNQLAKPQNKPFTAICEIAPQQKNTLLKTLKAYFPNYQIEFFKDLTKRTRFVKINPIIL